MDKGAEKENTGKRTLIIEIIVFHKDKLNCCLLAALNAKSVIWIGGNHIGVVVARDYSWPSGSVVTVIHHTVNFLLPDRCCVILYCVL